MFGLLAKSAPKGSVKSVSSVRGKNILRERRNSPASFIGLISSRGCVLFLTENTEEQNTQHSTETLSQPISQNLTATFSWNALWTLSAEGVLWARNCAPKGSVKSVSSVRERPHHAPCKQPNRGNLTYYAPPCGGGEGGGATILWARNVRQKAQWTLCALWEKKLPSELFVCYLIREGAFYFSQRTQKNRTHSIPQRH